tara:strand:- start:52 stop:870 length:819 start_codon:yes stop_codon:yes gene_type:complete
MRILSLGAGVQSSTLALMIERGDLPMVDAAIFADTKGEPKEVYDWLDWLETKLSYPIYKVSLGNLKQDTIDTAKGKTKYKFVHIPFFTRNKDTNKKGLLQRQCTGLYKINPVNQYVRKLLGLKKGQHRKKGTNVEMLMGISYDEMFRMRTNQIKWITNVYPLVDLKIKRKDCEKWFTKYYNKVPPRSACTFCPYKTNTEWLHLKNNYPKEWDDVIKFDKQIRRGTKTDSKIYLHRSCKPLDQVDLENLKTSNQIELFEGNGLVDECDGMCGV